LADFASRFARVFGAEDAGDDLVPRDLVGFIESHWGV
jgi:hypothetical protein